MMLQVMIEMILSDELRHLPHTSLGPGNTVIVKQGPTLIGVLGGVPVPAWVSIIRRPWLTLALSGMQPH